MFKPEDLAKVYALHREETTTFFKTFDSGTKYMSQLQNVANRNSKVINLYVDDLIKYDDSYFETSGEKLNLASSTIKNVKRYHEFFCASLDALMPQADDLNTSEPLTAEEEVRRAQLRNFRAIESDPNSKRSASLLRPYELNIVPSENLTPLPLRSVKSHLVGELVKVRAVVARVQPVRPCAAVMVYTCSACKASLYKEVEGDTFMPIMECSSSVCKSNKQSGKVTAEFKSSKLIKSQEIKLQECPDQVPVGCVPRSLNAVVYGENTRALVPGDSVTLGGVFAPIVASGWGALRSGLAADTRLEIHHIRRDKRAAQDAYEAAGVTTSQFRTAVNSATFYSDISRSIAPEIFGMDAVKKALILLLIGGVPAEHPDGMKIRGDLHMLLMGDPGVAKSQLLKRVAAFAPRAVYSTGKGSSGAGLTAAVMRDKTTGEVCLEGGALVLADRGVCCIDEFDKMDESDRTAIHQVMEQQVVSISKAGISTSLNARTSVLAAANPLYGRYDITKSAVTNMNLPASLLSRFDLQFLLLDNGSMAEDHKLALHVLKVHQLGYVPVDTSASTTTGTTYSPAFIRAFVAHAKKIYPIVPSNLVEDLASTYVEMRTEEKNNSNHRTSYTTPRALLAILRLAQAHARLHLRDVVEYDDILEAKNLIRESKASVETEKHARRLKRDPVSEIYKFAIGHHKQEKLKFERQQAELLKTLSSDEATLIASREWNGWISVDKVIHSAQRDKFTSRDVTNFIRNYEEIGAVEVNGERTAIRFVGV